MTKVSLKVSVVAPLGNDGADVTEVEVLVDPARARAYAERRYEERYYDARDAEEENQLEQTWRPVVAMFETDPAAATRKVVYQRTPWRPFKSTEHARAWAAGLGPNITKRCYNEDNDWFV